MDSVKGFVVVLYIIMLHNNLHSLSRIVSHGQTLSEIFSMGVSITKFYVISALVRPYLFDFMLRGPNIFQYG